MGTRPSDLTKVFAERFADGDVDGMLELYEPGGVFATGDVGVEGSAGVRAVLQGFVDSGAKLALVDPVEFVAGDIALVHWGWEMTSPDGSVERGGSAEVVRRQADGTWKFLIDNPYGSGPVTPH